MTLTNQQKIAALATALMLCGLDAAAENTIASYPGRAVNWVGQTAGSTWEGLFGSSRRKSTHLALEDVRDQREDARTTTHADLPALVEIMNEPMPNAPLVNAVLRPRTPTSQLFADYLTEPNIDGALADAASLVDELFQGDASAKLLLVKSSTFKLAENFIYDVPMRARVSYLDYLIRRRLAADTRGTLLAGDTIILAAATGVALASGLHYGPTELSAAIRDVNWTGLARDARTATASRATSITEAGQKAVTETAKSTRGVVNTLIVRSNRRFLAPGHRLVVQQEVNQLLQTVAEREPALVTDQVRSALKLSPIPVLRTSGENAVATKVPKLSVIVEDVTIAGGPIQKRLAFIKAPTKAGRSPKRFVSEAMDPATAERLHAGLTDDAVIAFNSNGAPRPVSAELDEAMHPLPADPVVASVERTADVVEEKTQDAATKVSEVASEAKEQAGEVAGVVEEKASRTMRTVTGEVADVVEEKAPRTMRTVTEVAAEGKAEAAEVAGAAKDKAADVVDATAEVAGAAKDKAADVVDATADQARTATTHAGAALEKARETVREYASDVGQTLSSVAAKTEATVKSTAAHVGERTKELAGQASAKAKTIAADAQAQTAKVTDEMTVRVNKTRAALKAEFNDFDRTAAFRDGTLVAAPGLTAWNVGFAYGFDAGQDHAAYGLEDQIPSELLQPVPLEAVKQNAK